MTQERCPAPTLRLHSSPHPNKFQTAPKKIRRKPFVSFRKKRYIYQYPTDYPPLACSLTAALPLGPAPAKQPPIYHGAAAKFHRIESSACCRGQ